MNAPGRWVGTLAVLVLAAVWAAPHGGAVRASAQQPQQPARNLDDVNQALQNAADHGNFDEATATQLLKEAGVTPENLKSYLDSYRKTAEGQNASGKGDWDLGQIFRDHQYDLTYPLTNNCKVKQTVTITYPTSIPIEGPTKVDIPPHSKIDVPMTLKIAAAAVPLPPWPLGFVMTCHEIAGDMTLTHPKFEREERDSDGWVVDYVCHEMERTHHVTAFLHEHPPSPPPDPGPGGKPKKSHACETLWNHGEFYADSVTHEPNQCRSELQQQAVDLLSRQIAPARQSDPGKWEWLPSDSQLRQMSVAQLLDFKARANQTAAASKQR